MYTTGLIVTFASPPLNIAGVRIRFSFLWPLLFMGLVWRYGLDFGLLSTGICLFGVIVHDLCHLLTARSTGGDMEELLLWPGGGLSEPYGRGYLSDHVHTLLAGPAANLVLAASSFWILDADELLPLLSFDSTALSSAFDIRLWQLAFLINSGLFLINLVPVAPFDGGVLARTYLTTRFSEAESRDLMIRIGLVVAIFAIIAGFVFDLSGLVALGTFVLVIQINDNVQWQETYFSNEEFSYEAPEEDLQLPLGQFFNSDSEFEKSLLDVEDEAADAWRIDDDQSADVAHSHVADTNSDAESDSDLLDSLLDKIHQNGPAALSDAERLTLEQVSRRLRQRKLET